MHRFLLHNDDVREASETILSAGQVGLLSGWGVFSTLRVYDGVPFAWERHWERMKRDAGRMRIPFPSEARWLEERLHRLIDANRAFNATLRVYVVRDRGGIWEGPGQAREFDLIAFTADVNRWPEAVKLGLVPHGRHAASEFAGTKYISWSENLMRYERAHEQGLDEVVLLNERGEVSECTSANVFAVQSNRVWTPPQSAGCLAGVTRGVLLEEVKIAGLEIGEKTLFPQDLESADEVFITSTTRELLPVASIEGLHIKPAHAICDRLQQAFSSRVEKYTAARRTPIPAI
jgi:branched-chain amino acid aminotransferase